MSTQRHLLLPGLTLLLSCLLLQAEPEIETVSALQQEAWQQIIQKYPEITPEAVQQFYLEYAPDLLKEWDRFCLEHPTEALQFLQRMIDKYLSIERVKEVNPQEYQRLLKVQKMESRIRILSREIQLLADKFAGKEATEEPELYWELQLRKQELRKLLEQSFEESQQHQQIEINRLETEMKMLKQRFQERSANRAMILLERFRVLTGLDGDAEEP
jgi:uncharacterized small protein (DUF1192 family)